MEPVEFVAVKEEDDIDDLRIESNCLPFDLFEMEEKKQELTDALKYCIDLLKDAQIILDLQNSNGTISRRSQLMGKEIRRRIVDMLYSMKFMDEEMECQEDPMSFSLENSCDSNGKELINDNIKFVEKDASILNQSIECIDEDKSNVLYNYENSVNSGSITTVTSNKLQQRIRIESKSQRKASNLFVSDCSANSAEECYPHQFEQRETKANEFDGPQHKQILQRSPEVVSRTLRPQQEIDYFGEDDSDKEVDYTEEQDSSNSEESATDDDSDTILSDGDELEQSENGDATVQRKSRQRRFVNGKDGHKWCLTLPESRSQHSRVLEYLPGVKNTNTNVQSPLDFWSLLFTSDILKIILTHTNEEIAHFREKENTNIGLYEDLTMNELKAFIGLMYFSGMKKDSNVLIDELWSSEYGSILYRTTMSQKRFTFIAARLRFDDRNTRAERRQEDLLAPVRDIWNKFIQNCTDNYTPSKCMTIDEQILGFRGRFGAKVYIKNRLARYGLKIVSLNDAKTFYMYNAIPYCGKVNTNRAESVPSYYVRTLCEPIYGSGRIVTCDNWFSSIEIFNTMSTKHDIFMVGTVRKNKRQIPESFKRPMTPGSTRYGYDGKNILLSYTLKKNKLVLLLSSYHKTNKIDEVSNKPEIVTFYNKNKCGTDVFDQLCSAFTCFRKTNRWPMRFFMGMLDQAIVNSNILYNFMPNNELKDRRFFLKEIALSLIKPHLEDRIQIPKLPRITKANIMEILHRNVMPESYEKTDRLPKRLRCFFCPRSSDRKTQTCCVKCKKPICDLHRFYYCQECEG